MPREILEGNTIYSYQWLCLGGGVICGFHFLLYAFLYFPNFLQETCITFVIKIKSLF